ncbi:MAG: fumarylacetoacetate hydrolase family protein [Candidatus Sericytochromatia bacterium]|nr:fumarylacetoacetate hydrolase family protein [Candidatus Sericytochromatia bacterium]
MYLVTFVVATPLGPFERIGALQADRFIDLHSAYTWYLAEQGVAQPQRMAEALIPPDMLGFLDGGRGAMEAARQTLAALAGLPAIPAGVRGETLSFDPATVQLLAPVPRPRSLRDFLAFEAHTRTGYARRNQPFPEDWFKLPVFYKGNPRTIVAPDTDVRWPRFTEKFDYELELAAVIGREGKDIAVGDAADYIAGYCILNDFSARDIQMREMALRLGPSKGKDFATGLGPYLVTPDELPNVRDLRMVARINGEVWSDGNAGTSHWTFEQMIAHAADEETLYPGDVIGSGTVGGGCGYELDRWLQPNDSIELEITGLGTLRHRIVR